MPTAIIVYASLTGCTEEMAKLLASQLEIHHIEVTLRHCTQILPEELVNYDLCAIGTYTYGAHGDLPDEIVDFYFDLEEVDLTGKFYATFGSGDYIYEFYCKSVEDFHKKLEASGGQAIAEPIKFELNGNDEDKAKIIDLAAKMAKVANA